MTKLITLAKRLDFKTEHEYFDYMIHSYINGNFTQCRELYNAMRKEDRKNFINYISNSNHVGEDLTAMYHFYVQHAIK